MQRTELDFVHVQYDVPSFNQSLVLIQNVYIFVKIACELGSQVSGFSPV